MVITYYLPTRWCYKVTDNSEKNVEIVWDETALLREAIRAEIKLLLVEQAIEDGQTGLHAVIDDIREEADGLFLKMGAIEKRQRLLRMFG